MGLFGFSQGKDGIVVQNKFLGESFLRDNKLLRHIDNNTCPTMINDKLELSYTM